MKWTFFITILIFWKSSIGQEDLFIINAGQKANDVIPVRDQYYYPEFLNGKVFLRDGKVTAGKMNYNKLTDEMHFLTERGDTLAIDNEPIIQFISIKEDTFYFCNGYILLLKSNSTLKLGMKEAFRLVDKRKETAYDMSSSSSSVSSFSSFNDGSMSHQLKLNGQGIIMKVIHYYFGDSHNHFIPATQTNLADLLPNCDYQLKKFCKKSNIDFTKRSDLEEVIALPVRFSAN